MEAAARLSRQARRDQLSMAGRSLTAAAARPTARLLADEAHGRGSSQWTVVLAAGAVLGLVVAFMQLSGGHDIRAQAEADARRRGNMYRPNGHPDMVRARRRARRREQEATSIVEDEAVPLGHGLGRTGPPVHRHKGTTPWLWQGDATATTQQPQPPQPPQQLQAQLAQQARRDKEVRDRLLATTATATAGPGRPPMEQANAAMLGLGRPSPEAALMTAATTAGAATAAAAMPAVPAAAVEGRQPGIDCAAGCETEGNCNRQLGRCDCPPLRAGAACDRSAVPRCVSHSGHADGACMLSMQRGACMLSM